MQLRAKNYFHSGQYYLALQWIDTALSACSSSSLSMLARFHYRRGKIMQGALFSSCLHKWIIPLLIQNFLLLPLFSIMLPPLSFQRIQIADSVYMYDPKPAINALYESYTFSNVLMTISEWQMLSLELRKFICIVHLLQLQSTNAHQPC